MEPTAIAERIKMRLNTLGKSASAAALEAGLSRSAVQDIIKGRATNPRLDTLQKLTAPLECNLDYLTGISSEPGASPSNQAFYALLDTSVTTPTMSLEVGVYREHANFDPSCEDTVLYRDARRPDLQVSLYLIGDHSLSGIGILKGDIATALDFEDEEIVLKPGMIAVVKRSLPGGKVNASEYSARVVEIHNGEIRLASRAASDNPAPIIVAEWLRENDDDNYEAWAFLSNSFWTEDRAVASIEGIIIRITRSMPL